MRVRGADNHDGVDVRIGDQFVRRGIRLRHVEFLRDAGSERAIDVRYSDDGGFWNARRQIADVDLAEPSCADDTDFELGHNAGGGW